MDFNETLPDDSYEGHEKEESIKSYSRAANDNEILAVAEEGIENYVHQLEKAG